MATGPYRRPGPGPWRVGNRPTTDASQPNTVGVIPRFIFAGPEPGLDPLRTAGYALVIASVLDLQGIAPSSEYQSGTHAQNIYEQQTVRAIYPRAAGGAPPIIGAFVSNAYEPQLVDLTPPSSAFPSAPTRQGPIIPITQGAPVWDLTQQGALSKPTPNVQGKVPPLSLVPPQPDTSQLGTFVTEAAVTPPAVTTGPVIPTVWAAPVWDLTLKAWIIPAVHSVQGVGVSAEYHFGDQAQRAYEQNASRFVTAASAVPAAPTTGPVPQLVSGAPVPDVSQLGSSFTIPSTTYHQFSPVVPPLVWAAPAWDLSLQAWIIPALHTIQGTTVTTLLAPQGDYVDVEPWIGPVSTPHAAVVGAVPPLVEAAPQLLDLTPPSEIWKPTPNTQGPVLPLQWVPQQVDLTLQAQLSHPLLAPPIVLGPVPPLVGNSGKPQIYELHLGTFVVQALQKGHIVPPGSGHHHPHGFAQLRLGGGGAV